jgi:hypothetical protein
MAALTTIAVSNASPSSVTLSLNGSAFDLTGLQVAQLYVVVKKMTVQNGHELPSQAGATVTLPAGF